MQGSPVGSKPHLLALPPCIVHPFSKYKIALSILWFKIRHLLHFQSLILRELGVTILGILEWINKTGIRDSTRKNIFESREPKYPKIPPLLYILRQNSCPPPSLKIKIKNKKNKKSDLPTLHVFFHKGQTFTSFFWPYTIHAKRQLETRKTAYATTGEGVRT